MGCVEGGLRLFGFHFERPDIPLVRWNPNEDKQFDSDDGLHNTDPHCLWVPRANAAIPWSSGENVNAGGYRGPLLELEPAAPTFRVAFLGDSSTFGFGIKQGSAYPALCAAALEAEEIPAESLNAGVVGHSIAQGLGRYRELVRPHKPDVVVIAFGAVNDHLFGPGQESDAEKILELEAEESWQAHAGSWLRIHLRIAHLVDWLRYRRSGGEPALRRRYREIRKRSLTTLEESGKPDYPGVRRVSLTEYQDLLKDLVDAVEADGARPILISMPRKLIAEEEFPVLIDYSRATESAATRLGVHLVDIRTHFRSYGEIYEKGLYLDYWHPRPRAHGLIADDLHPLLLSIAAERGHPQ